MERLHQKILIQNLLKEGKGDQVPVNDDGETKPLQSEATKVNSDTKPEGNGTQ